jgi:hypothetical protein
MGFQVWDQGWSQTWSLGVSPPYPEIFSQGKIFILKNPPRVREMGDPRESLLPTPNYNTPVKDLTYKDLLTITFTLASHERGIKIWCVTYLECVYYGKCIV